MLIQLAHLDDDILSSPRRLKKVYHVTNHLAIAVLMAQKKNGLVAKFVEFQNLQEQQWRQIFVSSGLAN